MTGRILVIRHGALGDIVLSLPAFAAIRAKHQDAEISLLTTAPFATWLERAPWFDRVLVDAKPGAFDIAGLLHIRRLLRSFDMIYDLQNSGRSGRYFRLAGKPRWSGIASGRSFPHANPNRNGLHSRERIEAQLEAAGMRSLPVPDLGWTIGEPPVTLPERFVALVPGAAPHRPEKRWPEQKFGEVAAGLSLPSVILGGRVEQKLAAEIVRLAPGTIDLTGRTTLFELAGVLTRAELAIGNDTGPMHLAAALGIRSIVLFGSASDPALSAPRYPDGEWATVLRWSDLTELPVLDVADAVEDGHNGPVFTP